MFWCNKAIVTQKSDALNEHVKTRKITVISILLHTPCWQEVCPDVYRLVVQLEAAEDAVQRRAPGVTVSRDDAVLPEHLRTKHTVQVRNYTEQHLLKLWGGNSLKLTGPKLGNLVPSTVNGDFSVWY